jgi:hypothetical protein
VRLAQARSVTRAVVTEHEPQFWQPTAQQPAAPSKVDTAHEIVLKPDLSFETRLRLFLH